MSSSENVVPIDRVRELIGDQTQAAFAQLVGMDPVKLNKSLAGRRKFSSLDLAKIADATHVTVDWLLGIETPIGKVIAEQFGPEYPGDPIELAQMYVELHEAYASPGEHHGWRDVEPVSLSGTWQSQGAALAASALAVVDRTAPGAGLCLADLVEQVFDVDVAAHNMGSRSIAAVSPTVRLILVDTRPDWALQQWAIAQALGCVLAGDDTRIHEDFWSRTHGTGTESERRADAFSDAFLQGLAERGLAAGPRSAGERIVAAAVCRVPGALLRDAFDAYQRGEIALGAFVSLLDLPHHQAEMLEYHLRRSRWS